MIVAFPKPGQPGAVRPIVMAGVFARCVIARVTIMARKRLRSLLEDDGQFAMSGASAPLVRLLGAIAEAAAEGVPWILTAEDKRNAFGSVSQRALAAAVSRLANVSPELAAISLRAHCSARDTVGLVIRGVDAAGIVHEVERHPIGGGQGFPDMPPLFAEAMCLIDKRAAAAGGSISALMLQFRHCGGFFGV